MSDEKLVITEKASPAEREARRDLIEAFRDCPIPDDQILQNLGLFLSSKNLSRILFMDYIYRQIIDVQGIVMEFGTRWGQNAALFSQLRSIYEPYNRHRVITAFDTFDGFPSISSQDGKSDMMKVGNYSTTQSYEDYLEKVMGLLEADNPLGHIKKFNICKGDAIEETEKYLTIHPETIVALAYFDFDIYLPTIKCLDLIGNRLTKGSVLAFDELNDSDCPGETAAVMEYFGLRNIRLKRYPYASRVSYCVIE